MTISDQAIEDAFELTPTTRETVKRLASEKGIKPQEWCDRYLSSSLSALVLVAEMD